VGSGAGLFDSVSREGGNFHAGGEDSCTVVRAFFFFRQMIFPLPWSTILNNCSSRARRRRPKAPRARVTKTTKTTKTPASFSFSPSSIALFSFLLARAHLARGGAHIHSRRRRFFHLFGEERGPLLSPRAPLPYAGLIRGRGQREEKR